MDNQQIAHDLAIAKLYGSDLPNDKLVEQYRQYFKEIKSCLDEKSELNKVEVIDRLF